MDNLFILSMVSRIFCKALKKLCFGYYVYYNYIVDVDVNMKKIDFGFNDDDRLSAQRHM